MRARSPIPRNLPPKRRNELPAAQGFLSSSPKRRPRTNPPGSHSFGDVRVFAPRAATPDPIQRLSRDPRPVGVIQRFTDEEMAGFFSQQKTARYADLQQATEQAAEEQRVEPGESFNNRQLANFFEQQKRERYLGLRQHHEMMEARQQATAPPAPAPAPPATRRRSGATVQPPAPAPAPPTTRRRSGATVRPPAPAPAPAPVGRPGGRPRSRAVRLLQPPLPTAPLESGPGASDVYGNTAALVSKATGLSGLTGTGGKASSGWSDVGSDEKQQGAFQRATSALDHGHVGVHVGANVMSGASDIAGGLFDAGSKALALKGVGEKYRKAEGGLAKAEVAAGGVSSAFGLTSNAAKVAGGVMTAAQLPASTPTMRDPTTAVKAASDWAGIGASTAELGAEMLGSAGKTRGWNRDRKRGLFKSKVQGGKGKMGLARSLGRGFKSATKIGKSGVDVAKDSAKLVGQIQGGGQIAAGSAKAAAGTLSAASAGLGIGLGGMEMLSGGSKGVKAYRRRGRIKAARNLGGLSPEQEAALQHLQEIQGKKLKTGAQKVVSGGLSAAAGALTLSGFGTVPGLALGGALAGGKLANYGYQKIKQRRRNKAAERGGYGESYADYKASQKDEMKGMGLRQKLKAKAALKMTPNWDKSSEKKQARYNATAEQLVGMSDAAIRDYVGLTENQTKDLSGEEKKKLLVQQLQKR